MSIAAEKTAAPEKAKNPRILGDGLRLGGLRNFEGIGSEQVEERIVWELFGALGEGEQALFELRMALLGLAGGVAAIEADHRNHQRRGDGEGDPQEEEDTRTDDARVGEGELVDDQDGEDGEGESQTGGD